MENKEQFLKIYANLPLGVRQEIILVLDGRPITWDVAYIEVISDTPLAKTILEKLAEIQLEWLRSFKERVVV
ncbi:MAG: hypothetical protein V1649_04220 [Patescibacteria group bacterium]